MKKIYLTLTAILCCLFLTGCFGATASLIFYKVVEDQIEVDAAILSSAEFYKDKDFIYIEAPVQTFRDISPGAVMGIAVRNLDDKNRLYPLSKVHKDKAVLRFPAGFPHRCEKCNSLPADAKKIPAPEYLDYSDWPKDTPFLKGTQVHRIAWRDNNSVWRKTGAVTCAILLDLPLFVIYSCSSGILAIPAMLWY